MKYDCVIIGMGIAGISAAIYLKRAHKNILMLEKNVPGGLTNNIAEISNYPGFTKIAGPDLAFNLFEQINTLKIEYKLEEVIDIIKENDYFKIATENNLFQATNVIIASGRIPRRLNLPNEKELLGKGISTCAICDGNLYENKIIGVIGGGQSALQETIYLANIAKKIYLIHYKEEFRATDDLIDKIKNIPNIEIIYNAQVKRINSEDDVLKSIDLDNGKTLNLDGLFIYIGFEPSITYLKNLKLNSGYLKVNDNYETEITGLYAIGDVIEKKLYQLVTAASEGAIAASAIINKQ